MGDLHLKQHNWANRPDLSGDAHESLRQVAELCRDHDLPLILTGDTFDSARPSSRDVESFRQAISGLRVYIIQGQHDQSVPPWPVAILDEVEYVHNKVFEPVSGVKMFGIDRQHKDKMQEALELIPADVGIVILHQLAKQVMGLEDAWDLDLEWMPDSVHTVLIGDFHQDVSVRFGNGGQAHYSGSGHMCSIKEPIQKSCMLLQGDFSIVRHPLKTREYVMLTVGNEIQLQESVDIVTCMVENAGALLPVAIARPVVVIKYLATVPEVEARIRAAAKDFVHVWLKPSMVQSVLDLPEENAERMSVPSLNRCLDRVVQGRTAEFVSELLLGSDTREVLGNWRGKLGIT